MSAIPSSSCTGKSSGRTVPLSVLRDGGSGSGSGGGGGHPPIRKSRASKWRAVVLILVHVAIAAHIVQWLLHGRTVSPVEPSESMYTLEGGQLNAGFIFFCVALIGTLVFGRFFCGWGCHVVALQDLCAHVMNKMGVRPKPFRSRLLLWGPLLLAIYMFVLPALNRMVLGPALAYFGTKWPDWLSNLIGTPRPFPGFSDHFIVDDFWRTFPPWYIAIPFLVVCGFGIVYFLGSKGFCTYGCPYGGFFAPIDKVSIGRIVVSDACEGCGHCTAVCTSNVRVHQEVRDYGMVVDPGCMKCMDCVSVCPNEALSFSFARPAVIAAPRSASAMAGKSKRPEYDLTRVEEVWVALIALLLFVSFRGMMNSVPMLMAAAMAGIGAFVAWKLVRMFKDSNIRLQSVQLKLKGKVTGAGWMFVLLSVMYLGMGAWSGSVRAVRFAADLADRKVTTPPELVLEQGQDVPRPYVPQKADAAQSKWAIRLYTIAGPPREGGFGWKHSDETNARLAWLHAVAGDREASEKFMHRTVMQVLPGWDRFVDMATLMSLRGKGTPEIRALHDEVLAKYPQQHAIRVSRGRIMMQANEPEAAATEAKTVLQWRDRPRPTGLEVAQASDLLVRLGRAAESESLVNAIMDRYEKDAVVWSALARVQFGIGKVDAAVDSMKKAVACAPLDPGLHQALGDLFRMNGREKEANEAYQKAASLVQQMGR